MNCLKKEERKRIQNDSLSIRYNMRWRKKRIEVYYMLLTIVATILVLHHQSTPSLFTQESDLDVSSNLTTILKFKKSTLEQPQQKLLYKEAYEQNINNHSELLEREQDRPLLFHFVHTTDEASFHRRSLRAVESVFFHHPNASVLIHVPDDGNTIALKSDMTNKPFLRLIQAGYNVTIQPFQLKNLIDSALFLPHPQQKKRSNTINQELAEKWMKTQILPNMMKWNWYVDISDLVRLLIVYIHGGTYMDTDVIVVNPIDKLPNSIGFVRPNGPGSGVLKFNDIGNPYLADCINEYFSNFRSNTDAWGYVGPTLLRRVALAKYPTCQVAEVPTRLLLSSSSSSPLSPSSGTRGVVDAVGKRNLPMIPPPPPLSNSGENDNSLSCPFHILWQDVYYPNVDNCFVVTPNTKAKQKHIKENTFIAHTYNQRTKWALQTMNITKMMQEDTLCNWLYSSFCIFCDDDVWE